MPKTQGRRFIERIASVRRVSWYSGSAPNRDALINERRPSRKPPVTIVLRMPAALAARRALPRIGHHAGGAGNVMAEETFMMDVCMLTLQT